MARPEHKSTFVVTRTVLKIQTYKVRAADKRDAINRVENKEGMLIGRSRPLVWNTVAEVTEFHFTECPCRGSCVIMKDQINLNKSEG